MLRKILIVDDTATNRIILKKLLCNDYEVLEAENGVDALLILHREYADLSAVLLDLGMPGMDGYELLTQIRANPQLAPIPVIVATGNTDEQAENKALSIGANDFVTKPYKPETIRHRLHNTIQLRETATIASLAIRDPLTGLYTREAFFSKSAELIAQREPGYYIMACFDVDRFKVINDQYGSAKGDAVLKHIAAVFQEGFSPEGGVCCRIMADDFAVLYPASFSHSFRLANIREKAAHPDDTMLPISFSIGRYLVDDLSLPISGMYDRASLAQASVKGRYDTNIATYQESMRTRLLREQAITSEMKSALQQGQFEVWFQPQYNHSTGALVGSEALVRWRHPERGIIMPGNFIPVFERNGFVYEIDQFIWEQTCMLLRRWIDAGHAPLPVSVNISRYDVFRNDFFDVITGLVKRYDVPLELLRLEITESAFAKSSEQIITVVQRLVDYGFTMEIDDFGSGYSSLNTLKDVPAQIVKLDMRFLENTKNSDRGGNIIESVVRMIRWLGMSIIAEGVETRAQADYLESIGCNYVQGYLYAKPMPVEDYETLAMSAGREEKLLKIETVETLDNNRFWDPGSMDTLIFNTYIGGACIFEWDGEHIDVIRANDKYAKSIGGANCTVDDALKLRWEEHLAPSDVRTLHEAIVHTIETRDDVTYESAYADLPGIPGKSYLRTTFRAIARASNRTLIYATTENITAQREAEQKEHEASAQMHAIMENIDGGVSAVTYTHGDIHYLFVNEQYCALFGYTVEQFMQELPNGILDIIHPDDADDILQIIQDSERLAVTMQAEFRAYRRDGSLIWVRSNGSVRRIDGVEPPVHFAVTQDITLQKEAIQRIETLNNNLQTMMNDTPGGFVRMKLLPGNKLSTVYVNDAFCRMRGLSAEEILAADSANAMATVHPDDVAHVTEMLNRLLNSDEPCTVEYRIRHASGAYLPFRVFARASKNEAGEMFFNAYYTDLSARAKQALTVRETMPFVLSAIMGSSTDLSFVKDRDFNYLCCSRPFAKMVGLSSEADIVGKTDYDLFDAETADRFRADDLTLFAGGESLIDYVEAIPSDDDVQHYSSTSKYILRDTAGDIIGLYGTGRDITDTRAAYARLKLLTDSVPGGLAEYAYSPSGVRLTYFNDGFCKLLGYTRAEYDAISKKHPLSLVFAEDAPHVLSQMDAIYRDGAPMDCVCRVHTKDGGFQWVTLQAAVSQRHGDTCFFNAVLYDVTARELAKQEAVIHRQEMDFALSKMGRIVAKYDIPTRTLHLPEPYAKRFNLPLVNTNVPDCFKGSKRMSKKTFAEYRAFYKSILRGEKTGVAELQYNEHDGTPCWERMEFVTIFDEQGTPIKALIAADDTTAQHRRYELEQSRPTLGEENLLVHALFNLNTGETLDYAYGDGSVVPKEERTAFLFGGDNLDSIIIDDKERKEYRALNDPKLLLARFAQGETEISFDYRRKLRTGDIIWVRNLLHLMYEPGGSDVLLFEYCYNIEDEKLRELMLASLISTSYDYVACINGRTQRYSIIANANVHYDMPPSSGADADAMTRELAEKYILPDDREQVIANTTVDGIQKNLAHQDIFQFICRELQQDGSVHYKKLTQYCLDRAMETYIITREDVTNIMRSEAEKSEALASALDAANQASRAKTAFLSRMSHELRTPMNAIIGLSALSATELGDRHAMENNISKIGISARYLLSLINDILEMSRIESGRVTLNEAPFDFEQFISGVNAIIYEQASAKNLDYDVIVQSYTEPIYIGDATKLQEILVNVLGNAVKFTPEGGKITLNIEQLRCAGQHATLRFIVADTGVGIDEAFIPHLFDVFAQASSNVTSISTGTGLGLAITKTLVELMSGHIQVKSIPGVGSVFTIDVQLGISDESRHYLDMAASIKLNRIRTLVVDDDVTVCKSTENVLKAMGMRAEWVDSGLRAVERVKAVHGKGKDFNAIFIDWKMPDMDGIETTRQIRKIVGPDVTIIIMTAYDWLPIEAEAREAGVDLFMEKPLFQSSIVRAFERVFLSAKAETVAVPVAPPDFTGKRFLLAEDHPLNVEVAKRLLERLGAQVVVVGNGLEALETFATAQDGYFDAILMDIRMPVMDGLAATKNIRNLRKKGSRDVPIIAMTANAFDEDMELSLSSGMNAHLAKPIEPKMLYATLQRLLKRT